MGDIVINALLNLMGVLEVVVMLCGVFCVPVTKKKVVSCPGGIITRRILCGR